MSGGQALHFLVQNQLARQIHQPRCNILQSKKSCSKSCITIVLLYQHVCRSTINACRVPSTGTGVHDTIVQVNAGQCNMHASLYYEYGQVYYQCMQHAGYYLLVLVCMILQYNAGQCNMHASLYYEYGMMLCINKVLMSDIL